MTSLSLTYPTHHFIDTAPLAARYAALTRAVLTYLAAGHFGLMLKSTHKVRRLVRVFTRLERHNHLLARKLKMLSDGPWRDRVLRELGGLRKLGLWEAASLRQAQGRKSNTVKDEDVTQPWLFTPAQMADSERLKAHARKCARASANSLIFREACHMDFEGLFRLAPLPRGPRAERRIKIYTQNSIVDYNWNPIPLAKPRGFGPAPIWPAEFYAAMKIEAEILAEQEAKMDLSCHSGAPCEPGRLSHREPDLPPPSKAQTSASHCISPSKIQTVRNGSLETPAYTILNPLPLEAALSLKTYRDLF